MTSVEESFVFSPVVPCVDNTQEPISSLHLFQNLLSFLNQNGFFTLIVITPARQVAETEGVNTWRKRLVVVGKLLLWFTLNWTFCLYLRVTNSVSDVKSLIIEPYLHLFLWSIFSGVTGFTLFGVHMLFLSSCFYFLCHTLKVWIGTPEATTCSYSSVSHFTMCRTHTMHEGFDT